MRGRHALVLAAAALATAGAAACHKAAAPKPAASEAPPQSDYVAPPELTSIVAGPAGSVLLAGTAQPRARVRLAAPDGKGAVVVADAGGRWSLGPLAAPDQVRLYSLSETLDGRLVRARGYVAVLPGAGAAMLRPATGARPLIAASSATVIAAVDFDAGKAGVVSGRTSPDQPVRILLDGQESGEGRSDRFGWFDITLSDSLTPAAHTVTAATPGGRAEAQFTPTPAQPIARPPSSATRLQDGWRIDWMAPGGGVQSTILFDPTGPAR